MEPRRCCAPHRGIDRVCSQLLSTGEKYFLQAEEYLLVQSLSVYREGSSVTVHARGHRTRPDEVVLLLILVFTAVAGFLAINSII